jgi:hypothetical protein
VKAGKNRLLLTSRSLAGNPAQARFLSDKGNKLFLLSRGERLHIGDVRKFAIRLDTAETFSQELHTQTLRSLSPLVLMININSGKAGRPGAFGIKHEDTEALLALQLGRIQNLLTLGGTTPSSCRGGSRRFGRSRSGRRFGGFRNDLGKPKGAIRNAVKLPKPVAVENSTQLTNKRISYVNRRLVVGQAGALSTSNGTIKGGVGSDPQKGRQNSLKILEGVDGQMGLPTPRRKEKAALTSLEEVGILQHLLQEERPTEVFRHNGQEATEVAHSQVHVTPILERS